MYYKFPKFLSNFNQSCLILEGSKDSLLEPQGSLEIAYLLKKVYRKVILYKNANHSLFNDMNAKNIYDDILIFLEKVTNHKNY